MLDSFATSTLAPSTSQGLVGPVAYAVAAWFLLAEGLFLYFLFRYQIRGVGRSAAGVLKSIAWVLVPAALVVAFDLAALHTAVRPGSAEVKWRVGEPVEVAAVLDKSAEPQAVREMKD